MGYGCVGVLKIKLHRIGFDTEEDFKQEVIAEMVHTNDEYKDNE